LGSGLANEKNPKLAPSFVAPAVVEPLLVRCESVVEVPIKIGSDASAFATSRSSVFPRVSDGFNTPYFGPEGVPTSSMGPIGSDLSEANDFVTSTEAGMTPDSRFGRDSVPVLRAVDAEPRYDQPENIRESTDLRRSAGISTLYERGIAPSEPEAA